MLSLMGFVGCGALDGMDYMARVAGDPHSALDPATLEHIDDE